METRTGRGRGDGTIKSIQSINNFGISRSNGISYSSGVLYGYGFMFKTGHATSEGYCNG